MKKKLLTLFVAMAGISITFGQSLVTTSPAAITAPGTDESYSEYQQGAEILFEGTVGDAGNVDSVVATLLYYGKNGTKIDSVRMGKIAGADLNGSAYTDTFNIPTDADISDIDTSMHMLQTRVYYAPGTHDGVHLTANATVNVIAAYQSENEGILFDLIPTDDEGYHIQLKRGTYFHLTGTYGIKDLAFAIIRLIEHPDGFGVGSSILRLDQTYAGINNGYFVDSIYINPSFPVSQPGGTYLLEGRTDYGADLWASMNFFRVVDAYEADTIYIKETSNTDVGKTDTLTATFYPSNTELTTVTWSSLDNSVATVSTNGIITGVGEGQTKIVATATTGVTDTCLVTVTDKTPQSVTISPKTLSLEVDSTYTLSATVLPANAEDKTVTYSSSNTSIASVTNEGVVTGESKGTANIIVSTINGHTDTCAVTVGDDTEVTSTTISDNMLLYPNPATNELNIAGLENGTYALSMYNILGVRYMSSAIEVNGVYVLPIENLNAGTYILMLENETGIVSKKLNIIK